MVVVMQIRTSHMNEDGRRKRGQRKAEVSAGANWVSLRQWSLPKTHGSHTTNTKVKSRDWVETWSGSGIMAVTSTLSTPNETLSLAP